MPLDTILLLDTSGSMAGRGITELKRACKTFLDGVEETARLTGLKENVAIVEFCTSARIVQSLSADYSRCRRAVGGIVRMCGLAMTPRIILMTDGEPTDSAGSLEGKKKVVATALGFGPGWKQLGLPHPVPIACVGCGACDSELLQAIAKITNGMYVIVGNVSELSTFFRRQVLLIRFAMQFAADMDRLRSQLALAAFLQELGEAVDDTELEAMMTLLLTMLVSSGGDSSRPSRAAQSRTRAITGPTAQVSRTPQTSSAPSSSRTSRGQLAIRAGPSSTATSTPSRPSATKRTNVGYSTSTTSTASRPSAAATSATTSTSRSTSSVTPSHTYYSPSCTTASSTVVVRSAAPNPTSRRGDRRSGVMSSCACTVQ